MESLPYPLALALIFTSFFMLYVAVRLVLWLKHRALLQRLKKADFPGTYKEIVQKIPFYSRLAKSDQRMMHYSILRFINEKEFIGVQGLEISDEMRVIISFYACLLLLRIKTPDCYSNLKTILVYPYEFVSDDSRNEGGIYTKESLALEGQSSGDTVVISWHSAKNEAYHIYDQNVVLHEFAHELDFMSGEIDGVPPMAQSRYRRWTEVMYGEYRKLRKKSLKRGHLGKYALIGEYAATDEAEFFAVASERFFETPQKLKKDFPELYAELESFYKIDTASLFSLS